jgi:hypothetical protein
MLDFLKNIPDMTNKPEITMTEAPKTSISQRIRDYKAADPSATVKKIAEAVGTSLPYVYQILGQPPKKAKKAKPVANEAKENNSVSKKELNAAKEEIETQCLIIDIQKRQTEKHLAIIEYLEGRVDELSSLAYG